MGDRFHLRIDADLRFGEARTILQLSREKLSPEGTALLNSRLYAALERALPQYFRKLSPARDQDEFVAGSLWAMLSDSPAVRQLAGLDGWKEYALWPGGPTLGTVTDSVPLTVNVNGGANGSAQNEWDESRKILTLNSDTGIYDLLFPIALRLGRKSALTNGSIVPRTERKWMSESKLEYRIDQSVDLDPLPDPGLQFLLVHRHSTSGVGGRISLPCPNAFARLRLDDSALYATWIYHVQPDIGPRMVSPFFINRPSRRGEKIVLHRLTELVRWVAPRTAGRFSEREVAAEYLRFIEHADSLAASQWGSKVDYEIDAVRHELRQAFGVVSVEERQR